MSKSTHQCPANGCDKEIESGRLACRNHWYQVSPTLRAEVNRLYRNGAIDECLDARARAVAEMNGES